MTDSYGEANVALAIARISNTPPTLLLSGSVLPAVQFFGGDVAADQLTSR